MTMNLKCTLPGLCLAFAACTTPSGAKGHDDAAPKGPKAADYYPLTVGSSWTYHVKLLGEDREQTITLQSEENGFFKDSAGSQLTVDGFGVRDQMRYLLREPVEAGTHWTNVVSASSIEDYKILSVESCTVPAGSFERCAVVEGRNRVSPKATLVLTLTFAPKVGLVKVATELDTGADHIPQSTQELVRYSLAPKPTETQAPERRVDRLAPAQ